MNTIVSRLLLAGGQNAVPVSGWFFGGWSPATTLALFWVENVVLTTFIATRVVIHWRATRTRGHLDGFLRKFLVTALVFSAGQGLLLGLFLTGVLGETITRQDLVVGVQWMIVAQTASLVMDSWTIGRWPFAEIRLRTEWLLGRVVMVHLSILGGVLLFAAAGQPRWFFSTFVVLKALVDIGGLLPRWQYRPDTPPAWIEKSVSALGGASGSGRKKGSFAEHWQRVVRKEREQHARDEEVVDA